ncbi:transposase [Burkholderia glumae]|uniref:transposase n=1 Tax=Burkholderia glumae TaxID=337 RepID=UPI0021519B05|nr:transposase [Burkholderia glumae]
MSQHFLLTAAARTLSQRRITTMGDDEAFALFKQYRWRDKDAICPCCSSIAKHYCQRRT